MSFCKRDYCVRFAKEDARRAKSGDTCLTTYFSRISELPPEVDKSLQKFVKNEATYVKTVDAWVRRVTNIKMTILKDMMHHIDDDITLTQSRGPSPSHDDDQQTHISATISKSKSVVSLAENDTASLSPSKPSGAVNHGGSAVGRAPSAVGSAIESTVESAVRRASSTARHAPAVGSVVDATPESTLSISGSAVVTKTLADSVNLEEHTEQAINNWYNLSCGKLEEQRTRGTLRMEQFKRKRALLRVEYWSKLDKLRNNATPTVIGI